MHHHCPANLNLDTISSLLFLFFKEFNPEKLCYPTTEKFKYKLMVAIGEPSRAWK